MVCSCTFTEKNTKLSNQGYLPISYSWYSLQYRKFISGMFFVGVVWYLSMYMFMCVHVHIEAECQHQVSSSTDIYFFSGRNLKFKNWQANEC